MNSLNSIFTRELLAAIKKDFRAGGFQVPHMTTIRSKCGSKYQYEIWTDGGSQGWFSADDAADAKYQYLSRLLAKLNPEEGESEVIS